MRMMAPIVHIIDPDPDTIITLKHACANFFPWDPVKRELQNLVPDGSNDDWGSIWGQIKKKKKSKKTKIRTIEPLPESNSSEIAEYQHQSVPDITVGTSERGAEVDIIEDSIQYHVSSRHLMLASPVFRGALRNDGFEESIRNESDGFYHVNASDWDAEAFLIVMRVIHNRNKEVPRRIGLEMLAKIAVLEDYYQFGETLEVFKDLWLEDLGNTGIPNTYCRDLVLWIWVAWTFDVEEEFREATLLAIKRSREAVDRSNIPIPERILEAMEEMRCQAIESIITGLLGMLDTYRSNSYTCPFESTLSFQCGSFLLGALTKGMYERGLLEPRPHDPFRNWSFEDVCTRLQDMESPGWSSGRYGGYGSHGGRMHPCDLNDATTALVQQISAGMEGLDLAALKSWNGVSAEAVSDSI